MATSGSYDFLVTRDNLITDAHLYIGAIGEGESCTTAQVTEAARILNMIIKLRAADGMPAWALKRGFILPFTGASSIATDSHVVTFYAQTTISADEAATETTISITSGTDTANGDQIGIELDDGSMHWTTISSGGGTTTPVIASGLPSAAASGNMVYVYTASADRIQKPLRIIDANVLDLTNNTGHEINIEERSDYFNMSNRTSEGVPNLIFYDLGSTSNLNLDNGQIYVWPRFIDGNNIIEFTYIRPFQDFDASSDNPDFPPAFSLPLMLELAALLGPKFGVESAERKALREEALFYRMEALQTVVEEGSLSLQPKTQDG
jgi:hypothetical protein